MCPSFRKLLSCHTTSQGSWSTAVWRLQVPEPQILVVSVVVSRVWYPHGYGYDEIYIDILLH